MVDRKLLIPVQNFRNSNAILREGLEIGEVRLVDGLVANGNEVGPIVRSVDAEGVVGKGDVNAVQVSREERRERMGDTFNLPHGILEPRGWRSFSCHVKMCSHLMMMTWGALL